MSRRRFTSSYTKTLAAKTRFGPFSLFVFLALLSGCASSPDRVWYWPRITPYVSESTPRSEYNETVFDYAWTLTERHFYDASFGGHDWAAIHDKHRATALAATSDDALYKSINDMLDELGSSHLVAITPQIVHMQKKVRNEAVSMLGFVSIKLPNVGTPVIYEVAPNSPASDAGVKRGWLVLGDMVRENPDAPLREGETVHYTFSDEHDSVRTLPMTLRAVPTLGTRTIAELRADGILYLRFDHFDSETAAWVRKELKTNATSPNLRGVVLDLRLNGGGQVGACRRILGEFFAQPVNAGSFIDRGEHPVAMVAKVSRSSAHYAGPLAVLVARMSGSGAEVFADAIQSSKRGVIVGSTSTKHTAGAVLMSLDFNLPGGGKLQIPVRDYVTASGKHLEGVGVLADVDAPLPSVESLRAGTDAALERAVSVLLAK